MIASSREQEEVERLFAVRTTALWSAFWFIVWLLSPGISFAEPVANWDLGPVEIEDQFPLALLHATFVPQSPAVLKKGESRLRAGFAWTNTINRKGLDYMVDAEVRSGTVRLNHAPVSDLELGVELPLIWRGGGVLDSFIYNWHKLFGLSQGPRNDPDIEDNDFAIEGKNSDGSRFEWTRTGTQLGDLSLHTKYLISEGDEKLPAWSLTGTLRLPTGAKTYGQEAVDVVVGLLASKRWNWFSAYGGAGYTFIGDEETENLRFSRHRFSGFTHFEARLHDVVRLLVGLHASSRLVEDVLRFPGYELYLDMGGKILLTETTVLEILVRENPAPGQGTADVTFLLALSKRFLS